MGSLAKSDFRTQQTAKSVVSNLTIGSVQNLFLRVKTLLLGCLCNRCEVYECGNVVVDWVTVILII